MSDFIPDRRQICHCGHDRATHYFDERGPGDCLAQACECCGYKHVDQPGGMNKRFTFAQPKKRDTWPY